MRTRTALAAAVLTALSTASLLVSAGAAAAAPTDDRPKYVLTMANMLEGEHTPPCYRDLWATPAATICS